MIGQLTRISAILCGLTVALHAGGGADRQTTARHTLRFAGPGERVLTIGTVHGTIRVAGHRGADVRLDVRRTATARSDAALRQSEENVRLELTDGRAHVQAVARDVGAPACGERWEQAWQHQPRYSVAFDFDVLVPDDTRLVLCTVNGGEIDVRNSRGNFEISNVNGRITLTDVDGAGSAETVNGPIAARLTSVPDVASRFKTVNGDVTVTWPAALAADLRMKTFNGGLFTDFEILQAMATAPAPARRQADGRFVFGRDRFTEVRVGRGGPTVTLESFNGDVRVLRGSR